MRSDSKSTDRDIEAGDRLVASPRLARLMLDVGNTHLYELIEAGELESYLDGRSRKIIVDSIYRYIQRRLQEVKRKKGRPAADEDRKPQHNATTEGPPVPEVASADSAVPPATCELVPKITKRRTPRPRRPGQPKKTGSTEVLP